MEKTNGQVALDILRIAKAEAKKGLNTNDALRAGQKVINGSALAFATAVALASENGLEKGVKVAVGLLA